MADLVYRPIILTARTLFAGARPASSTSSGSQNIPRTGGAVLAINHTSYLDFALGGLPRAPARPPTRAVHGQGRDLPPPGRRVRSCAG